MPWPRDDAKLERVRTLMGEHDLDALVVRAPDNVLYLTNFWGMKGYDAVVFPREGEPVLICLEASEADADRTAWTREVRLFLHGGDDRAEVSESGPGGILVRLIGGGGDDAYTDASSASGGKRTVIHDDRGDNRIQAGTEAKVDTINPERGPMLIVSADSDQTVPWAIANAAYRKQKRNEGVTEIVKMTGRGHALTIDAGWREVAQKALEFVKRFT